MRVCVYAIACNEGENIEAWLAAVGEADVVYVTDTGSTDNTPALLRAGGAIVSQFTEPFRFDAARNYALEQAKKSGADIYVSLDLDEIPEAGWRSKLEQAPDANGWRIEIDNGDSSFKNIRAHRDEGWTWRHACHEVLCGAGPIRDAGFKVVHHQDLSKPRSYLPLLELDAEENPTDGRAWHYLGREYMYLSQWDKAIDALTEALSFDMWQEQRSMSCVYISRCMWRTGDYRGAREYAWRAVREYGSREAWVHLTWLLNWENDPTACIAAENALKINRHGTYPSEAGAWNSDDWLIKTARGGQAVCGNT
ncbi:MAG: glycosyltransferase [Clostridia bacterium]|nr:glycosyltransferase [Clostridia bacterium]